VGAPNTGDHSLGRATGAIDRYHGSEPCPAQSLDRIQTESRVLPYAGAHAGFGEFHDHGRSAADEQRERVLEDTP